MARNQRMAAALLVAALLTSLFLAGTAPAQAQHPAFVGTFTLTQPTHWGKCVLQPGNYTITVTDRGTAGFDWATQRIYIK